MKIKDLLTDESKWTKGAFPRYSNGRECQRNDPTSVCWCLFRALSKCYRDAESMGDVIDRVIGQIGEDSLSNWNDAPERTFEDVQKLVNELDI